VALLTTGAVLGLSASSREEDLENLIGFRNASGDPARFEGNTQSRYEDLIAEGEDYSTFATVAFIGAGVAAVVATGFFVLDARSGGDANETGASSRSLIPVVTSDGGLGLAAGWEF
jgi:hypothetical protein